MFSLSVGLTFDLKNDYIPHVGDPIDYSAEFDSEETIHLLQTALDSLGCSTVRIGNIKRLIEFITDGKSVDIVFNIAEGMWGRAREAQVPGLLEAFQIPFTFSDPLTLSICLDKGVAKTIWQSEGLLTPRFSVISDMSDIEPRSKWNALLPLFVKPIHEGSSKGIGANSFVSSSEELIDKVEEIIKGYRQAALIEQYLPGREFSVAILGNRPNARVLGIMEIIMVDPNQKIYGYDQKQEYDSRVSYKLLSPSLFTTKLSSLALQAYYSVGCRDAGRVDIRCDQHGEPHLLEINPLPGLHPVHSDLAIIARLSGMAYEELIEEILRNAISRTHLARNG